MIERQTRNAAVVHIAGGRDWTLRALLAADLIEALETARLRSKTPRVEWDATGAVMRDPLDEDDRAP